MVMWQPTSVWLAPSLSDTAPPSPSPAVGGAPHTGGRNAEPPGRPPAAALPREVSAASLAPVCALKSASGSLAPDLREAEEEQKTVNVLQQVRACKIITAGMNSMGWVMFIQMKSGYPSVKLQLGKRFIWALSISENRDYWSKKYTQLWVLKPCDCTNTSSTVAQPTDFSLNLLITSRKQRNNMVNYWNQNCSSLFLLDNANPAARYGIMMILKCFVLLLTQCLYKQHFHTSNRYNAECMISSTAC